MALNIDKRKWLEDNIDVDRDEAKIVIEENCKELIINEMSDYIKE